MELKYKSKGTFEDEKKTHADIARQCPNCIVEIGVFDGNTSQIFLDNNNNVRIYGIDPIIPDSMAPELIGNEDKVRNLVYKYPNFVFIKDFSYYVVKEWIEPISYIFIDGNHNYDAVRKDFEDWLPFVEIDGYISLHDSGLNRGGNGWPGPSQLSDELLSDNRVEYVDTVGSMTIFKKK
jgi:hypothetical protein